MHDFNWEPMFEKLDQAKLTPHAFSVCVRMPHLCNTCGGREKEWQHYGPAPDKNRSLTFSKERCMDETMVQRVARAIMEAGVGCEVTDWREAEWNPHIAQVLAEARAAIEAMRSPTDDMLLSGNIPLWVWEAMLDAALATPPA